MRDQFHRRASRWTRRPPRTLPPGPLWGLGAGWSGRRNACGTWNAEGQWLSFGLAHFRGQYWNSDKPRLVVTHEFKVDAPGHEPSLNAAASTAAVQYVSDNNPLRLEQAEYREWMRSLVHPQDAADWADHVLALDGVAVPARLRVMPNGFCVVAETEESFLAISARHMAPDLRLARQDDHLTSYRTR